MWKYLKQLLCGKCTEKNTEMKDKTFYCPSPENRPYYNVVNKMCELSEKRFSSETQEAIDKFNQEIKQSKQMETRKRILKWQDAQRIIAIAWARWKNTLIDEWSRDISLQQNIIVNESYYQDMRKVCTKEQHELFDEIFGKDINILPKGTWALVAHNKQNWNLRCSDGKGNFYESGNTTGTTCNWKYQIPITEELAQQILNIK
jgi:hypothetical protein